ncbi:hypothetical protein [Acidocella aminolytica]|uniref:hypothetical protein n=1 Tax=Acidocella aminolytica TaxID=33998 RepID=UPI0006624D4D|nr:hypothetical protein [Acidocella aminolytica]
MPRADRLVAGLPWKQPAIWQHGVAVAPTVALLDPDELSNGIQTPSPIGAQKGSLSGMVLLV